MTLRDFMRDSKLFGPMILNLKGHTLLLSILFSFAISLGTFAKTNVWVINKDHSELLLSIPYMSVSDVTARLRSFSGKIYFESPEGAKENTNENSDISRLSIEIKANSFDSNHRIRDGHVKGEDFLDTHKYPLIHFESENITKKGNLYRAVGELTLKGITKPFELPFTLTKKVKDTWGHTNRFVNFESEINRKDFGVTWSKGITDGEFLVGEVIKFKGNIQIQPIGDKTPSYKHMLPNTYYIQMSEKLARGEITKEEFKEAVKSKATAYSSQLDPTSHDSNGNNEDEDEDDLTTEEIIKLRDSPLWKTLEYAPPPVRDGKWWVSFSVVSLIGTAAIGLSFAFFYEIKKKKIEERGGEKDLFVTLLLLVAFCIVVTFFTALNYLTH